MSWRKVRLGEILINRQDRFKPNDKTIEGLKRIDKIDFSGEIYISDNVSNTDMILVKKGDLVISGINVEKGAMAVYTGKDDIIATIHYSSYSFDEKKIDIEFLKYFLKSLEFKAALKEQVPGGIKTEIKPKHLLSLLVYIPTDITDQREIVVKVKGQNLKVEDISTELTNQKNLVKQLRQVFLKEAMQGKLVPQNIKDDNAKDLLKKIKAEKEKSGKKIKIFISNKKEDIPFEIPDNWVWCRLGDLAIYSEAGNSYKAEGITALENEWGVIKTSAITSGLFSEIENKKLPNQKNNYDKIKIEVDDILFCRASGSKELAGKSCIVNIMPKAKLILSDKSIRYIFSISISKQFIQLYNSSLFAEKYYQSLGTGKSTSMNNITRAQFNNLPVPLPPLRMQNHIVQKLEQLMQLCDKLEQSITESKQQNELLLQQALKEALENKTNVLPILQSKEDRAYFKRIVLANYIINQSLQDSNFGDVKFEKLLHLVDYFGIKRNLGQSYYQLAAGPYDNVFTHAYFSHIDKQKLFKRHKKSTQYFFEPGQEHIKSTNYYNYFSEEELSRVNKLINYFTATTYEQPEIVSTLYAVWNNRIIRNEEIGDELLVQDFYNWDKQKTKYERSRLLTALNWMRKENITPDGWGKLIEKAKKKNKV